MKNSERQKRLDEAKWYASIEAGKDMGGQMEQCEYCDKVHPIWNTCNATQADRENLYLCATAYNRAERASYKSKKSK